MRVFLLVGLLCLFLPTAALGQYSTDDPNNPAEMTDLTINQTDNAVQLVDHFRAGFSVSVKSTSTSHCVSMIETSGTCTALTGTYPKRICRKSGQADPLGWEFTAKDGWYGQICVKAEDTGVVLKRSRR